MKRAREEGETEGEGACSAASAAMEEGCKEQVEAEAVPGTLLNVTLGTGGLLGTVASAHRNLGAFALTTHMLVAGVRSSYIRDATRGRFSGAVPSAILQGALRELDCLAALHDRTRHAPKLYATRVAVEAGGHGREDPLLRSWQGHHRDAVSHAMDAKRKLRSAASIARAVEYACSGVRSVPRDYFARGSPAWIERASAVNRFALHAAVSAALAQRALRRMHDAVALEFYDAWRALKG